MESYEKTTFDASGSSAAPYYIRTIKVDESRAFLLWIDANDDLKCRMVGYNNNASFVGTTVTLTTNCPNADACLVDSNKVAVIYQDTASSDEIYVVALTISSMTLTAGTAQQINGSANNSSAKGNTVICSPTSGTIVAFYRRVNGGTNEAFLRAATVSGTVFTFGTEVTESATLLTRLSICPLGTSKIMYFYNDASADGFIKIRTLSGTTLSAAGAAVAIYTSTTIANEQGAASLQLDTDKALLYLSNDNGEALYLVTASGTTGTLADTYQIRTLLYSSQTRTVAMSLKDSGSISLVYKSTADDSYYAAYAQISGTDIISVSGDTQISTDVGQNGGWGAIGIVSLAAERFLVAYNNITRSIGQIIPFADPAISWLGTKRNIAQNVQVSWKLFSTLGNKTFTIAVSSIGGNDAIGINPGAIGSPANYRYYDESEYTLGLSWERGLNMPTGGLTKALAEARLDNTSGRFTPGFMGGVSELFTSILPRRPIIINAGLEYNGSDQLFPQFAGILSEQPEVSKREGEIRLSAADYVDFFQNRYLDQEVMFTSQRTDQVYSTLLQSLGMSTSQYDLDYGINIIPFGLFEKGTRYSNIFHQLAEAENGHFYQDETGIFKFENRQHWDSSPFSDVQYLLLTGQVIDAEAPSDDHLVNVVEIRSTLRQKQPAQTIFNLPALSTIEVEPGETIEKFFEFQDPVLSLTNPTSGGANSYFVANTASDESGTDVTSSITITNVGTFAKAVKYRIKNNYTSTAYITQLVLSGRIAKYIGDLYYREKDDSSVTAYQEHVHSIDNDYIQNESWAASYARMILNDYSEIENLQKITIRAIPSLSIGDLISWQGRLWRIFDLKAVLNRSAGFIQELTLLQRTVNSYFRIGISTIGSSDQIAP